MLRVLLAAALLVAAAPSAGASASGPPEDAPLLVVVSEPGRRLGGDLVRASGGALVRGVPALSAQLVRAGGPGTAARLARRSGVRYVEPLVGRHALSDAATPERVELALDEARALVPALDGRGGVVAVLDTGVDAANPDLQGRVEDGGDYLSGVRRPGGTVDAHGHGTGVAALAAAAADGQGIVGAAPAAGVRSYRVLDGDGRGGSLALALAVRQVADDAAAGVPVVVANMSLGGPFRSRVEAEALAHAARVAPQVLFVAAAGNDGGSRPSFPAAYPRVLSVGASERGPDGTWRRAAFSTTADVDVLAPGAEVLTHIRAPDGTTSLGRVSGTSQAAPAVAGLAAGLAAGRGVQGQHAATLLKAAAEPAAPAGGDPVGDGSGRVDALAAATLGDGTRGYSTVFADGGARLEPAASRVLAVHRFDPAPAATATALLETGAGALVPGPVVRATAAGGTLVTQSWTFRLPDGTAGRWRTSGRDGEPGDDVPFAGLAGLHGEQGRAVRSGERVRSRAGDRAALVSFAVPRGARFTVSGGSPHAGPDGGPPLYLWAPQEPGGAASSYDEPVEQLDGGAGPVARTATVSGRWVVGHLAREQQETGVLEVAVTYPEPVGVVEAEGVSSSGTAGLPFRVSWSGAARYDVQWTTRSRTPAGTWRTAAWRTWLRGTAATSAVFGGPDGPVAPKPGETYHLRVVPHDDVGGTGDPSPAVAVALPVDDADPAARWSAGWTAATGLRDRWLGTVHTSSRPGSSVALPVQGSELALVADRGPHLGQVDVLVDGVRRARVDLGADAPQRRAVAWRSGPLPGGLRGHVVTLVVVGTPGRPLVAVDGVVARR